MERVMFIGSRPESDAGFSLVETIVALGLLAGALACLGQMFAISIANNASARSATFAAVLAEQKMEQLRGLMWGFDSIGAPLSDTSTDTALPVESPTGGKGLSPSPADSLRANVGGYVDYLDQFGRIVGGGVTTPDQAVYVRRWAVEPLPSNPSNTLVLQVVVRKLHSPGTVDRREASRSRLRDEARLMTVRTRRLS